MTNSMVVRDLESMIGHIPPAIMGRDREIAAWLGRTLSDETLRELTAMAIGAEPVRYRGIEGFISLHVDFDFGGEPLVYITVHMHEGPR